MRKLARVMSLYVQTEYTENILISAILKCLYHGRALLENGISYRDSVA